jgi:hypothetical protein
MTVDKHVEALAALLKKISKEGQMEAVEKLCQKLKLKLKWVA